MKLPPFDPYHVLGMPANATAEQIKAAHRKLVRQHHPDRNRDPAATVRFMRIQEAYGLLSDPARRGEYDQHVEKQRRERAERARREQEELQAVQRAQVARHSQSPPVSAPAAVEYETRPRTHHSRVHRLTVSFITNVFGSILAAIIAGVVAYWADTHERRDQIIFLDALPALCGIVGLLVASHLTYTVAAYLVGLLDGRQTLWGSDLRRERSPASDHKHQSIPAPDEGSGVATKDPFPSGTWAAYQELVRRGEIIESDPHEPVKRKRRGSVDVMNTAQGADSVGTGPD